MDAKLTLTIEQNLIVRAKAYARDQGRSLSDLVESYFKILTSTDYRVPDKFPAIIEELKGSFKAPDDFDYNQALINELQKKHL